MAAKESSRRDYLKLAALDPKTGRQCEVQVSFSRMQAVGRRSLGHARECGTNVPAVLQHPTAVFEGLRLDEDEDLHGAGWRCYCGLPEHAYHADGTARAPYPGQVYLVFVNDENVAYNWRWDKAAPDDPTLPIAHADRFRSRLL